MPRRSSSEGLPVDVRYSGGLQVDGEGTVPPGGGLWLAVALLVNEGMLLDRVLQLYSCEAYERTQSTFIRVELNLELVNKISLRSGGEIQCRLIRPLVLGELSTMVRVSGT